MTNAPAPGLQRRALAELLGTLALVGLGTGAIVVDAHTGGAIGHAGVALAFGAVVMAAIYAVGDVSGAHLNPAVSAGFWLGGRIGSRELSVLVASQCAGALLASGGLRLLFPEHPDLGATLPSVAPAAALALEAAISFLLMWVILGVVLRGLEAPSGLAIGGTVALAALVVGPLTGASMNPARSLGPALVSGQLADLWIYWTAPFAGAALAVGGCRGVRGADCCRRG